MLEAAATYAQSLKSFLKARLVHDSALVSVCEPHPVCHALQPQVLAPQKHVLTPQTGRTNHRSIMACT
jgi:hypothetical protein